MKPLCNRLTLEARQDIRALEQRLINHANRLYLGCLAFVFGTILTIEAFSGWLYTAS